MKGKQKGKRGAPGIYCLLIILSTFLPNGLIYSHENKFAHPYIATEAFSVWPNDGSHEMFQFLGLGFDTTAGDCDSGRSGQFIREGAKEEDDYDPVAQVCVEDLTEGLSGYYHHFYECDEPEPYNGLSLLGEFPGALAYARLYWELIRVFYSNPATRGIAYWYLGRIAHLLADVSVPAHVHDDPHIPIVDVDSYEAFMAENFPYWSHTNANQLSPVPETWNLGDLFWNLAQRTQYFPSNDEDGNITFANTSWFLGWPDTTSWSPGTLSSDQCIQIGNRMMPLAIQYTAALYKLFYYEFKIRPRMISADFDGDSKADIAVYRTSTGAWYIRPSGGGAPYGLGWGGNPADKPILGDYDGDGRTDHAIFRGGTWFVYPSGGGSAYAVGWGMATDKPVPADYDGDGKADIAVYRDGIWFIYPSGGESPYAVGWGNPNDKPVPGDYDGDRKADHAVYRGGTWFVSASGGGSPYAIGWGTATDKPVPGDYNGDGKIDYAVYRDGTWFVSPSGDESPHAIGWGTATDKPVVGDYDRDGKTDIAVYRPGTGAWYIIPSSGASPYGVGWGGDPSDVPLTTNPD